MTSGRKPAAAPPATPVQAARGEHWWPVALAIVVAAFLHVALPAKYRVDPAWVVPAVLLALLAALISGGPGPHRPAEDLAADRHRRCDRLPHGGEPAGRHPPVP